MSLLTETQLREELKNKNLDALREYHVQPGTIVTPSARAYLADHKIELRYDDGSAERTPPQRAAQPEKGGNGNLPAFHQPVRYESAAGGYFDEKPEHMTALRGTKLVNKDHPVIRFRGRLDSLEARVLMARHAMIRLGLRGAADDLGQVCAFTHDILRCEVLEQPLTEQTLLGMSEAEIRERSHTPKKYYGVGHFMVGVEHGEAVAVLNDLRTQAREVELCACDAFKDEYGTPVRTDLIRALNRLSSLFYVMMFKVVAKEYE